MTEDELVGVWIVDPVRQSRLAALNRHFDAHGAEMGAQNAERYVRMAVAFAREKTGKGYLVSGLTPGVRRWRKAGKYIDIAPNGEIVSFGKSG